MHELILRLRRKPAAALRLLLASLLINVLGLASSLYVMLILNRYVTYGITATLLTLTSGAILAVCAEFALRALRIQLAQEIVDNNDERLATGVFGLLLTARTAALDARPLGERTVLLRHLEQAESVLSAPNLATLADLPFSLLFLIVLALLSPALAGVALGFFGLFALAGWWTHSDLQDNVRQLTQVAEKVNALTAATSHAADALRQFGGQAFLMRQWQELGASLRQLRLNLAARQTSQASQVQGLQSLLSVCLIAVGAVLVVAGDLSVGTIIGANIIAARALQPLSRLIALGSPLRQADQHIEAARRFAAIEVESGTGTALPVYRGNLELRGVGFHGAGHLSPLLQGISVKLAAGEALAITGRNGCGKTQLARIIVGLIEPTQGQVLADGVEVRQLATAWWRTQVSYVPQETVFLDGTLRENLVAARTDLSEVRLRQCLAAADLLRFVDELPQGLEFRLQDGGRNLAPGLRRRLALARALAVDGPLVVMDEPSDGLDREGIQVVYQCLLDLARQKRTIVVVTHDTTLLRGAGQVLDLDQLRQGRRVTE
ncbi:MAG: ATP-binding cassette domain-containing protein [Methylococcaceae bacterium]|nr:MAG: ATP-binding cassette domain-containing protein [Methylococcaceae bacterium]